MPKFDSPEIAALRVELARTKLEYENASTSVTRAAYQQAWNALEAALVARDGLPKPKGRACRAGQRQHAEMRAQVERNKRRSR